MWYIDYEEGTLKRLLAVVAVGLVLFASGCFFPEPEIEEPDPNPPEISIYLDILDFELQPTGNQFMPWVVVGHAKNIFLFTLGYAEVRVQFYDSSDVLLYTGIANVLDLPAGTTWEFTTHYFGSADANRVDHVSVSVGTCIP